MPKCSSTGDGSQVFSYFGFKGLKLKAPLKNLFIVGSEPTSGPIIIDNADLAPLREPYAAPLLNSSFKKLRIRAASSVYGLI